MPFSLPELPFAKDALAPLISAETFDYHHGKHHKAYVDKLNTLLPGTKFEKADLNTIVKESEGVMFNQAAQHWNHSFYWDGLAPKKQAPTSGNVADAVKQSFGSFDALKEQMKKNAGDLFGSGWVWLVKKSNGDLALVNKGNAGNPLTDGDTPILTCDVWEHAYYIDYRNARVSYFDAYWQLINWDFVGKNLEKFTFNIAQK